MPGADRVAAIGRYPSGNERGAVIDIVKDYASIALGAAQATTGRVLAMGRGGLSALTGWGRRRPASLSGHLTEAGVDLRDTAERSREVIAALVQSELDRLVAMMGLVPESELIALRQQVERLERQLAVLQDNSP